MTLSSTHSQNPSDRIQVSTASHTESLKLSEQLQAAITEYRRLKYFNQILGSTLALTGILLGLISTLYGINDRVKLAAGFAAASATVQAILFAYPLESRSKFYRKLVADGQNLLLDLNIDKLPEQELKLLERVKSLRLRASTEEPEGTAPEHLERIEQSIASLEKVLSEYEKLKEQVKQPIPKDEGN
ncbi:hypothetical protein [Leptolyngbya sp. 7M]|uniref:hypothetical protein n=1 Tax=Leptolyngbya sp. 7M TaxID=2812896 RepID=UPI001B8D2FFF|nr:hypothetical protein [Leptolyngbya sp. 7M]QYO67578.1 hypothetical protein JVX88_12735 [Leptolyngbya sp. 7M]